MEPFLLMCVKFIFIQPFFFLLLIQITREKHVMNLLCDLSHECSSTGLGFLEKHFVMTSVVMLLSSLPWWLTLPCFFNRPIASQPAGHGDSSWNTFLRSIWYLLILEGVHEKPEWPKKSPGLIVIVRQARCNFCWSVAAGVKATRFYIYIFFFFVVTQGSGFHVYLQKHLQCTWKPWPHWTWRGNSQHLVVVASAEVLGSLC